MRYVTWLKGFATGDLGQSLASGQPVSALLWPRFWATMGLAAYAAVIGVPLAVGLGILTAVRRGGCSTGSPMCWRSPPCPCPSNFPRPRPDPRLFGADQLAAELADTYPGMGFSAWIEATTLPMLTLLLVTVAQMMRMTRTAVLAVMDRPYIETAYLKGLPTRRVVMRHATPTPNAAAPIANVVAFNIAYLITASSWWMEAVFNLTASAASWWTPCRSATFRWCRPPPWSSPPSMSC